MKKRVLSCIIFALVLFASTVHADFSYRKPELKGQVIDTETKEPIAGAVVSVYYENGLHIDFADKGTVCIHVYETTTDEGGMFHIPAYTTVIWPTRYDNGMGIIIYKPGYSCFPEWTPLGGESVTWFFDPQKFGKAGDRKIHSLDGPISFTYGVVEFQKLVKWMDRMRAIPSPNVCSLADFPLLLKARREESRNLGLRGE